MVVEKKNYLSYCYLERQFGFNSDLARLARDLVRVTQEKTKPNGERLREYADSGLPSLEQQLFSTAPIYSSLETVTLADSLAEMQEALGENNPIVQKILRGKTPAEVARNLIDGTKLDDVAVRKQLYSGGVSVIEASSDPLIVLARSVDPEARAVRKVYDDEVEAVERQEGDRDEYRAVPTNGSCLPAFRHYVGDLSRRTLQQRSQRGRTTWCRMAK